VLFSELEGERSEFAVGDVQYHLGQQSTLSFPLPVRPPAMQCTARH
jgi:2-oxoglutarate dehydrogenase complex dehydrogenase (E1) component-like enzyme